MLAGLLQQIENRSVPASRAWATHRKYLIVDDAHADALRRQTLVLQSQPQDLDAIDAANRAVVQAGLNHDTAWNKFKSDRSFIDRFCDDLGLMLNRVPFNIEPAQKLKASISDLDVKRLDAWIDPPVVQDLETLRIRLVELTKLVGAAEELGRVGRERIPVVRLPSGVTWKELEIRFTSEFQFQVFARGKAGGVVTFADAGFGDRRSRQAQKPTRAWTVLLALANNGGMLWKHHPTIPSPADFEKRIGEIRKRLKTLCGLEEDPFQLCDRGEYQLIPRVTPPAK